VSRKNRGKPKQPPAAEARADALRDAPAWTPFAAVARELGQQRAEQTERDARRREREAAEAAERARREATRAAKRQEIEDPEAAFAAALGLHVDALEAAPARAQRARPVEPAPTREQPIETLRSTRSAEDEAFLAALFEVGETAPTWSQPGREADAEALARGAYGIDAEVDLHGLTEAGARDRLQGAIADALARNQGVLRVVHGQGHNSPGGRAKLRGACRGWLQRPPLVANVIAWAGALPGDGGEGATLVLLRTSRVAGRGRGG
jgi:DNA-nicking Smr family endonuclease